MEALLGAGVRAWFAEYQVLLDHYDAFQSAIADGVRRSAHAIVFTNDMFASSPHCQRELDLLFGADGPGTDRTIEVKIPDERRPHQTQPRLSECRSLVLRPPWNERALSQTLAFISSACGLEGQPGYVPPPSRSSSVFTDQIKYYRLAIDGWDVVSEGGSFGQTQTAGGTVATHLRGPTLRTTLGSRKAVLDLNVGIGTVAPRVLPGAGAIIDERQSFHENRAFAATYFRAHALRAAGLHLLFLPSHTGRFSHLALTYWHQRAWVRRYSVILPDPLTGTSTEFAFIFRFSGPFNEFCRAVHRADAVVLSLQWPGPPVQAPPPDPPNFSSFDPELLLEAARAKAWKPDAFFTAFDWFRSAFDRLNLTPVGRFGAAQQLKPLVNGLEHTLPHKAIAVTCEVLALLPEDARTWRFGASVLVRLGRYADAERCADRAVEASDPQERGRSWTFLADCRRERALRDPTLSSELRHRKLMSAREAARQAINLGDGYGAQMLEQAEQALRRFESEARR